MTSLVNTDQQLKHLIYLGRTDANAASTGYRPDFRAEVRCRIKTNDDIFVNDNEDNKTIICRTRTEYYNKNINLFYSPKTGSTHTHTQKHKKNKLK